MKQLRFTLILDEEKSSMYKGYYQYRSQEEERGRPVVDGVYIQREELAENPPKKMKLVLEWT